MYTEAHNTTNLCINISINFKTIIVKTIKLNDEN